MLMKFTAHDVRRLRVCVTCGGIDHLSRMIVLPTGLHHDVCVVSLLTEDEILSLPETERRKFSIGAVGSRMMKRLLEAAAYHAEGL